MTATLILLLLLLATGCDDGVSPTETYTLRGQPVAVRVTSPYDDLPVGDTMWLYAQAFFRNGRTDPSAVFTWRSSDESIATVDTTGSVSGIAEGRVRITASMQHLSSSVWLTVFDPRPRPWWPDEDVMFPSGTYFSPDIIRSDDPHALDSLVFVGRDSDDAFLFTAHLFGSATLNVEVHPVYDNVAAAHKQASTFLKVVGRLPRVLIAEARRVRVARPGESLSTQPCSRTYTWAPRPDEREYLEEDTLYEGVQATLWDCQDDGFAWREAIEADGRRYISSYSRDHVNAGRYHEDMADSFVGWFISRCVPDRLHPQYKQRIDNALPARMSYFDSLNLDTYPWECGP